MPRGPSRARRLVAWPRFARGLARAASKAYGFLASRFARFLGNHNHARDAANGEAPRLPLTVGVLDRHLLRQCIAYFVLVVIAVCALWVAVNLSENLEDIRRNAVPLIVVVLYYVFSVPQILHDILPLAFLIAFLATATVLERHNETTALKAAGISLSRVALPLLLLGLASGVGLFFLDDYVMQRAERSKQKLEDVIKGRKVARSYRATDRPFVFLPDGRTLVNFLQFDPDTSTLVRPSVYVFDDRFNLRTRYMARRATYRGGRWVADDAWSRTFMADAMPEFVRHKAPWSSRSPYPRSTSDASTGGRSR